MTEFQLTRLRNTPCGHKVVINNKGYKPSTFNRSLRPCRQCCFGGEDTFANDCEFSSACLAHLREDKKSVVFKRVSV